VFRPKDTQERILHRLKIAQGHLRKVIKMVEEGEYCIDVITQTSAVKQALSGIEDMLLENHLSTCAINQIKKGNESQAIEEIIKVYKLKRR